MAIWTLRVALIIDYNGTRKEMHSLIENGSMNDILDRAIDMEIRPKDRDGVIRHRETKE